MQQKTSRLNKAQSSWFILPIWNQSHSLNSTRLRAIVLSHPLRREDAAHIEADANGALGHPAGAAGGRSSRVRGRGGPAAEAAGAQEGPAAEAAGGAGGRSSRGTGGRSSRGSGGRSSRGGGRQAACGGRLPELPKGPVQPERLKQPEQLRPGWPRCNRITGLERKRRSRAMRRRRRRWLW